MLTMRPGLPTYSPVHSPTHPYPHSPRANTGRTRLASTAPREHSSSPWEPDKSQIAGTALWVPTLQHPEHPFSPTAPVAQQGSGGNQEVNQVLPTAVKHVSCSRTRIRLGRRRVKQTSATPEPMPRPPTPPVPRPKADVRSVPPARLVA